jgi:Flp pilus assembly protein TadG
MHKRNRAQALIEFVLIVPVMLVILLGMIDLGRAFVFGVSVQNGAREAARLAEISATDQTVSDSAVLTRLIAASNPALIGCGATLGNPLSCGGGTWTFTIDVTTPAPYNQHYTSISVAKADAHFSGSQITVTARGSVSMLAGLHFGWGDNLFPIFAQGQASMAVF